MTLPFRHAQRICHRCGAHTKTDRAGYCAVCAEHDARREICDEARELRHRLGADGLARVIAFRARMKGIVDDVLPRS